LKDSSGYDILCDGKKVGTLLNGKNGAKGEKGDNGAQGDKGADGNAGSDCSAKALTDGSGFELSCGGKVVGTIKNGQAGSKGENGADCSGKALENGAGIELTCGGKVVGTFQNGEEGAKAKNCIASDKGDGNIAISCDKENTIIRAKALCGQTPYDPEKKVCLGVYKNGDIILPGLAPLCNGKPYNPYTVDNEGKGFSPGDNIVINKLNVTTKQECKDGVIVNVCGNEEIDLERQFCYDKKIYDKCNGKKYNLNEEVCQDNKILKKCGNNGDVYDPETHVCTEGKVLPKCGDDVYDPEKDVCKDGKVLTKCGDNSDGYDPQTQVCKDDKVLTKCGDNGEGYDPETHVCTEGKVLPKCGDEGYDPEMQECENGHVVNKVFQCGKETYDPKKFMCDRRDDRLYKITTIIVPEKNYSETWMAENLSYATGNNHVSQYGFLYSWLDAVGITRNKCDNAKTCDLGDGDIQGVCPMGWHLPSEDEWKDLITAAGGTANAGKALKSQTGWKGSTTNDDSYSFTALPAGYVRVFTGRPLNENYDAYFWSSSQFMDKYGMHMVMNYDKNGARVTNMEKGFGLSVRCLKNKTTPTP
jgi:uncharacterized protein (TIGR02145 family)